MSGSKRTRPRMTFDAPGAIPRVVGGDTGAKERGYQLLPRSIYLRHPLGQQTGSAPESESARLPFMSAMKRSGSWGFYQRKPIKPSNP